MTKNEIHGLSIVIPAYNASTWLQPTVQHLDNAARKINVKTEILIVDDGSHDDTLESARRIRVKNIGKITVLTHPNQGRFLTRKKGVLAARYDKILFIDTRVWLEENSLEYVYEQMTQHPERKIWNGDVTVSKQGNIIARFQDAVTCIGWRKYHFNRRLLSYDIHEFDHYPKGTTLFLAPKKILIDAMEWFESTTNDIKNSSDDTLLIRHVAQSERIWISPGFTCTYFARTTLSAFIKHTYFRGQFFVDGFLRSGTRFFIPLIIFLVGSALLLLACILIPRVIPFVVVATLLIWVSELVTALTLKLEKRDALALFILSPLFTIFYGLGIWRAFLRRVFKTAVKA